MTKRRCPIVATVALCISSTLAAAQQSTELKGLITARDGDTMKLQTSDATGHTVVLTDDTKVRTPKGLGLRHQQQSWTSPIPGLAVKVKGVPDAEGQLVASQVEFSKENLQTASMIQAGLAPTQAQVEANKGNIESNQQNIALSQENIEMNRQQISADARATEERFDSSTDYDVKGEMTIYFNTGSGVISPQDKATLSEKAAKVVPLKGYLIEVKGFADASGDAAMNQTLSRRRAEAVVDYLMQNCNIAARHIVAPGAMGISNPVGSNETTVGRKENRRVEIKLMVNKAVGTSG
jgi:OOP family OmpA-OmpF porin